jgi:hypothetical protein
MIPNSWENISRFSNLKHYCFALDISDRKSETSFLATFPTLHSRIQDVVFCLLFLPPKVGTFQTCLQFRGNALLKTAQLLCFKMKMKIENY